MICGKYGKFKNHKVSYIFEKSLVLSIVFGKFCNKDEKIFWEKESIEKLEIICLTENI